MLNKRTLTFYSIFAVLAVTLRIVPHTFGAAFVFIDILSGLLVYFAAKFNWTMGIVVCLASTAISASINIGEAVFFICINGTMGLSLGIIQNRIKNVYLAPAISALLIISMLLTVNCLFGIRIFGYSAIEVFIYQALTMFLFLYIYCFICLKLAMGADKLLHKYFI